MFPKFYNQDSNYLTTLFIITVFQDILVLKIEIYYHGNQLTAVLMACNITEEIVLVDNPLHLDYINVLHLNKLHQVCNYLLPHPHFTVEAADTWYFI